MKNSRKICGLYSALLCALLLSLSACNGGESSAGGAAGGAAGGGAGAAGGGAGTLAQACSDFMSKSQAVIGDPTSKPKITAAVDACDKLVNDHNGKSCTNGGRAEPIDAAFKNQCQTLRNTANMLP